MTGAHTPQLEAATADEASPSGPLRTATAARLQGQPASPEAAPANRRHGTLGSWIRLQGLNVTRHGAALRPFCADEFGDTPAAPTESHIAAANSLVKTLRDRLLVHSRRFAAWTRDASIQVEPTTLAALVASKENSHQLVMAVEKVWDFYFELFGQRQSPFAPWLLSCDRIALDCYQAAYLGLGTARSIPAPPPFSYMRTGFSPATYRRGIPLRRLGLARNPFPLIQLPYHRLVNPWTLGAILHEVSHNLQNDLGLAEIIPQRIAERLLAAGLGPAVARVWRRWNRETFADLSGLLLGGPAIVGSLMDVIGRSRDSTLTYSPRGPHPTPYLRLLLSCHLLARMGFPETANRYRRAWQRLYPRPSEGNIPEPLLATFEPACRIVVETICFEAYATLGDKALVQVLRFGPKEQRMIEEAGERLAKGTDPGVVPERFLIGASRIAVERGLAPSSVVTKNFYHDLARR